MRRGEYKRTQESRARYYATIRRTHAVVVTGTPRSGVLSPYIGRVFGTLKELADALQVTPRTTSYWLSMGYVNRIKTFENID